MKTKRFISCLLIFALSFCLFVPALAEETEPEQREISISSMEDFIRFRSSCIQDAYSRGLTVRLMTDLDFTDLEFQPIPSFSGTFLGNQHTIKGISLKTEGSHQGLFRYLTDTAVVRDLQVSGEILPTGSRKYIGGIAGSNEGLIKNCSFKGQAEGTEATGGIAGINHTGGILEGCTVSGSVRAAHFAGGMAGQNYGVIRRCKNLASINTREEDNKIDSVSLDPDFLTGKEAVDTATDLGGIAGGNSGMIRDCVNHGNVGYPRMGYNLGGICGSQRGYITGSVNYGTIQGRKEVAGIAGQMEPVVEVSFQEDTLQILRRQLENTSSLANRASSNIQAGSQALRSDIEDLHGSAEIAAGAIQDLLPQDGKWPDLDTIIAAKNALSSSIGSMEGSMGNINESAQSVVGTAAADIRAINHSIADISRTLDTAGENLGGTITDISDADTEDDLTGKIQDCRNEGPVSGDLNAGGIVGAAAWENDKDPEEELTVSGDRSLNFDSHLRAVILNCSNSAKIQAKKRQGGGIVGNLSVGLVKNCLNIGFVEGENADYIGGIAGFSNGFIRENNVKCKISGKSFTGGIAGAASIVSDCRSTVLMEENGEKLGSVIGFAQEDRTNSEDPIYGNYYLPLADHIGAIDGIDYFEKADSLSRQEFLALEGLSPVFRNASMTFRYPDGSTQKVSVPLGDVVEESRIPAPPRKEGQVGKWKGLQDLDLNHMYFDVTLEAEYTPSTRVLVSDLTRWDGQPILLAEGSFGEQETVALEKCSTLLPEHPVREAWMLPDFGTDRDTVVHLTVPKDMDPESGRILIRTADGSWVQRDCRQDGSYLVFSVSPEEDAAAVYESHGKELAEILSAVGGAAVILILTAVIVLMQKKKRKKKPLKEDNQQA